MREPGQVWLFDFLKGHWPSTEGAMQIAAILGPEVDRREAEAGKRIRQEVKEQVFLDLDALILRTAGPAEALVEIGRYLGSER